MYSVPGPGLVAANTEVKMTESLFPRRASEQADPTFTGPIHSSGGSSFSRTKSKKKGEEMTMENLIKY